MLTKFIRQHLRVQRFVVRQNYRRTSSLQAVENESNHKDDFAEEDVIYNTLTGGVKHRRRKQRIDQLQRVKYPTSNYDIPVSLGLLSPELKSKLLGDLSSSSHQDEAQQPEISSSNLDILSRKLESQKVQQANNKEEEGILLDFMTSSDHNPRIPPSEVPCGGCGAHLHCQDPHYPGFIPFDCFYSVSSNHLRSMICQRCYILKHHKKALQVEVSPDEYPRILEQIKHKRALVLLIVDITDFPCSIWPHLNEIIGMNRPVVVVGNKVDLLPHDGDKFLDRITKSLREEVTKVSGISEKSIKHISVVSARTGYGMERLINKLHANWSVQGDVYLVGCTNVGKSSIFNALLSSDYCKVQASNLVQKATISNWPGTTLNLLKFPILRPSPKMLYERTMRMKSESIAQANEEIDKKEVLRQTRDLEFATLTASVGKTFEVAHESIKDPFSLPTKRPLNFNPSTGINSKEKDYVDSRWCFDTPGVVYPEQVINILTEQELDNVLPSSIISPRSLTLKVGQTFFLGGLGRIDYIEGSGGQIILTVFSSSKLPLTVCMTKSADSIYKSYLGTDKFLVPSGDKERLAVWPALQSVSPFQFSGLGWKESVGDIVLSSAGWVAVTLSKDAVLQAHTPLGLGIYLRQPSMLPFAVSRRGPRIERTPVFEKYRPIIQ